MAAHIKETKVAVYAKAKDEGHNIVMSRKLGKKAVAKAKLVPFAEKLKAELNLAGSCIRLYESDFDKVF